MTQPYECGTESHALSRRQLLGSFAGAAAGASGLGALLHPAVADQVAKKQKQVLLVWIDGGMSQYESWDPKPDSEFGGPFRPIATTIPGVQFSELLENTAKQAHHLTVVRSMSTKDPNHSTGVPRMLRGDPPARGVPYPYLGSAMAKFLHPASNPLPPYIHVKPGGGGFRYQDAGFLGPKYGALMLGDGKPPPNLLLPASISSDVEAARQELRRKQNERFGSDHRRDTVDANAYSYNLAAQLMQRQELFDTGKVPAKDIERYGKHDLGRHLLLARRLLEAGTTFVMVTSFHWDTHADNFNQHLHLMPQFDRPFAALIEDLHERKMLDNVLVVAMSEFGRTPRINHRIGRDHWPEGWSLAMAGAGLRAGTVVGKTEPRGGWVDGAKHDVGDLFFTMFDALGLDGTAKYSEQGQQLPVIDPKCEAIQEALA
jgi:uncharacterized protein (DUF1501 family)